MHYTLFLLTLPMAARVMVGVFLHLLLQTREMRVCLFCEVTHAC